jgi:hypothetical protein
MRERAVQFLRSPRLPWVLAALSLILTMRAVGIGFQADDHVLSYYARHDAHSFSLFAGSPAEVQRMRSIGAFAWWTSPRLSFELLRPLSSLTHRIEFRLWPNAAWAMHASSNLIYAVLVLVVAQLYRRFLPDAALAGLAALIFTVDEGHAPAVGWLASRNTVLSALFALLALAVHIRAREQRRPALHALAALCVALGLAAGEGGLMALALLFAYACVYESGSWLRRIASLAPELGVFAVWGAVYATGGYGMHGTSWYRELDPPLDFLLQGIADVPLWLFGLLGPSVLAPATAVPPLLSRSIALAIALPLLALLVRYTPASKPNRFFALSVVCCLPALFATQPQERLLLIASFGGAGLIAGFIDAALRSRERLVRGAGRAAAVLHVGLAPLLLVATLGATAPFENGTQAMVAAVPAPPPREVVFVNTPCELLASWFSIILQDGPAGRLPASHHQLYAGSSALDIVRVDATTLEITPEHGWGRIPFERILSNPRDAPRAGAEIEFTNLHVSVLQTNERHMPSRVRFRFPSRLESPERKWLVWQGTRPMPWRPPSIGERVSLPALSVFTALRF